jgi:hypothetical protein
MTTEELVAQAVRKALMGALTPELRQRLAHRTLSTATKDAATKDAKAALARRVPEIVPDVVWIDDIPVRTGV